MYSLALNFVRMCGAGVCVRNRTLTLDYRHPTCYLAVASFGCIDCDPAVMPDMAARPKQF